MSLHVVERHQCALLPNSSGGARASPIPVRALLLVYTVGMGNRPGHFIGCVQIVRIPSHEPKKVLE
jgi:hypothetical protein